MEYPVEQLIKAAKVAIDENVSSEALTALGDLDTLTLDEILLSKVEDAARLVEEGAAHYLLDAGKPFGASVEWESQEGYGAGKVNLPSDFMRLVTFRMSDWFKPVTEAITEEHPLYVQQSSRYLGVRGNPERPVVAIVHGAAGQVLEFYSCSAGPGVRVSVARYLPIPTIKDSSIDLCPKLQRAVVCRLASIDLCPKLQRAVVYRLASIDLCPKLQRAVVYRLASMACAIVGRSELAALLLGTSNELAGIVTG